MRWIGRLNKDCYRLRIPFQNRKGTLDVNFKNNPFPMGEARCNLIFQRSVPIFAAIYLAALNKSGCFLSGLKLFWRQEMVVDAWFFSSTRRPCSSRNAWNEFREVSKESAEKRRLPDAGRARENDELTFSLTHRHVLPHYE